MSGVSSANVWTKIILSLMFMNLLLQAVCHSLRLQDWSTDLSSLVPGCMAVDWVIYWILSSLEYLQKAAKRVARETVTTSQTSSRLSSPIHSWYKWYSPGFQIVLFLTDFIYSLLSDDFSHPLNNEVIPACAGTAFLQRCGPKAVHLLSLLLSHQTPAEYQNSQEPTSKTEMLFCA